MKNGIMKVGSKIYRKLAIPEVGPPAELGYPDEWDEFYEEEGFTEEDEQLEEEFTPEESDAYMTPSGQLGSRISLSVEQKFLGEYRDEDEAKAALVEWTEDNNYWPNLWYVDDHGGMNGPVEYGLDAGPGRQEGATYRKGNPWSENDISVSQWMAESVHLYPEKYEGNMLQLAQDAVDALGLQVDLKDKTLPIWDDAAYYAKIDTDDFPYYDPADDMNGPVEYGLDAGPGRQEGATYRQSATPPPGEVPSGFQGFNKEQAGTEVVGSGEFGGVFPKGALGTLTGYVVYNPGGYTYEIERTNGERVWIEHEGFYLQDSGYDPADDVMPDTGHAVVGPSSSDYGYWNRYGSRKKTALNPAYEYDLPDEEMDLPEDEYDMLYEEDGLPGEEEGIPLEEDFPFDVSVLDDGVTSELGKSGYDPHGDFSLYMDEIPADEVPDLDAMERTLNDASIVTTFGGRYSLEKEGDSVFVNFDATVDEVADLIDEFGSDEDNW